MPSQKNDHRSAIPEQKIDSIEEFKRYQSKVFIHNIILRIDPSKLLNLLGNDEHKIIA